MPNPTWIVQENLANEERYDEFIAAIAARNIPHQIVKVIPFAHVLVPEVEGTNYLAFGSTSMEAIARKRGWTPGTFTNDRHNVKEWFAGYGSYCLNHDGQIVKFGEIPEYTGTRFIRPLDDSKSFAGHQVTGVDLKEWQRCTLEYADSNSTLTVDTEVLIAPIKKIHCEYRFFVVKCTIVAGSLYRERGNSKKRRLDCVSGAILVKDDPDTWLDKAAYDFTNHMIDKWTPGDNFVIDVCHDSDGGWKVVEINSLTSAGFYDSDTTNIVKAIHQYLS